MNTGERFPVFEFKWRFIKTDMAQPVNIVLVQAAKCSNYSKNCHTGTPISDARTNGLNWRHMAMNYFCTACWGNVPAAKGGVEKLRIMPDFDKTTAPTVSAKNETVLMLQESILIEDDEIMTFVCVPPISTLNSAYSLYIANVKCEMLTSFARLQGSSLL